MALNANVIAHSNTNAETNPCVRNCCLDDKNICMGCGRSLTEILEWHHADYSRQQQINIAAKNRLAQRPKF